MFSCVGAAAVYPRSCQHADDHQLLRVKTNFPKPSPRFPTPRNLGLLPPRFPGEPPSSRPPMYIIGLQEMMIDGMGPKLSKIVPTLIVRTVWTASGPKM